MFEAKETHVKLFGRRPSHSGMLHPANFCRQLVAPSSTPALIASVSSNEERHDKTFTAFAGCGYAAFMRYLITMPLASASLA